MNLRTKILLAATVLMMSLPIAAQEVQSRHAVPGHRYLKEYWGRSELYLQHLDLADKTLNENTPSLKINNEREMSLLMIDAVTHEPKPIENPAVLDFLAKRMNHVIADLDKPIKGKKTVRMNFFILLMNYIKKTNKLL